MARDRPAVPVSGQPAPESGAARLRIRGTAVAALAVSVAYLVWRAASTLNLSAWWLSLPLLALEAQAVAGLALFTLSAWDVRAAPPPAGRRRPGERVAVAVCISDEPTAVLLASVASAVALEPTHETWVVDTRGRPDVRRLARDLGAHHVVVPAAGDGGSAGAAGAAAVAALDAALATLDADIVAVLDGDQLAAPALLSATLGYFDDPELAVVQTASDLADRDAAGRRRAADHSLFHGLLQPGRNRWGAALWCGPGSVLRVAALRAVGGVAGGTADPELHTTIRLHRAGWRTVYHDETLTTGLVLTPASRNERSRRATGAMQLLRVDNPLTGPGLRWSQRLAHLATLLSWFDAWRWFGYLAVPPAILLTGAAPVRTGFGTFAFAVTVTLCLQRLAVLELTRDRAPHVLSAVFDLVRMPGDLRATLAAIGPSWRAPAGGTAASVLTAVQWACALTGGWAALTWLGLTPVSYDTGWVAWGALGWVCVNGALAMAAARYAAAEHAIGERRAAVRFDLAVAAQLGDYSCDVVDVSLAGAGVRLPASVAEEIEVGDTGPFGFVVDGARFSLDVTVRSRRLRPDRTVAVGLGFDAGQDHERARLALALFHSQATRHLVPEADAPGAVAA